MDKSSVVRIAVNFFLIVLLLTAAVFLGSMAIGYKGILIVSDSMNPVLKKGDMIFVKYIPPIDLRENDIAAFRVPDGNMIVVHRIYRIDEENGLIYTAGDANFSEDPRPVPFSGVVGRYEYKIPLLGILWV